MTTEQMLKRLGKLEQHLIDAGPIDGRCFVMLDLRINVDGSGVINAMTRDWSPDEAPKGQDDAMRMLRSVFADWAPYRKFDNLNQLECILMSYRDACSICQGTGQIALPTPAPDGWSLNSIGVATCPACKGDR